MVGSVVSCSTRCVSVTVVFSCWRAGSRPPQAEVGQGSTKIHELAWPAPDVCVCVCVCVCRLTMCVLLCRRGCCCHTGAAQWEQIRSPSRGGQRATQHTLWRVSLTHTRTRTST